MCQYTDLPYAVRSSYVKRDVCSFRIRHEGNRRSESQLSKAEAEITFLVGSWFPSSNHVLPCVYLLSMAGSRWVSSGFLLRLSIMPVDEPAKINFP